MKGTKQLSWRDPAGFVMEVDGRILRAVAPEGAAQTKALLSAPWMSQFVAAGSIPSSAEIAPPAGVGDADRWFWLEHARLPFPVYPHETTALQLYDAAELTLRIAIAAATNGWVLKDASAWNVLFSEGRPVFVDLLSFERRGPSGIWVAYGQFIRHFLLPLMLSRKPGIHPAEIFICNRDGITPERAYQLLPTASLLSVSGLELVLLPKWLSSMGSRLIDSQIADAKQPSAKSFRGDLLIDTLRRLLRTLEKLRPDNSGSKSTWKRYEEERSHYGDADIAEKSNFVRHNLGDSVTVLDLGCNAGEFSILAADEGRTVVAADFDHPALDRLYERIRGQGKRITPVVLSIGRPTPAVGWQNTEVASYLDRAAGRFDCILMLGLIHHLLVTERMTLPMLLDLLLTLNPKRIILEWVDPEDPKFRQLAGLNGVLYSHLDSVEFENCLGKKFRLNAKFSLPCGTRVMYLWSR
jgi:SAM-dependent methyltransferase